MFKNWFCVFLHSVSGSLLLWLTAAREHSPGSPGGHCLPLPLSSSLQPKDPGSCSQLLDLYCPLHTFLSGPSKRTTRISRKCGLFSVKTAMVACMATMQTAQESHHVSHYLSLLIMLIWMLIVSIRLRSETLLLFTLIFATKFIHVYPRKIYLW